MKRQYKILTGLILTMLAIKIFDIIFDPNKVFPGRNAAFSWIELAVVAVLGFAGLYLYQKIKLPAFDRISWKAALISVGAGVGFALLTVVYDSIARIGDISVGWPLSIVFYIWGTISTEVIFRVFAISLLVWLASLVTKKHIDKAYWTFAALLSAFAAFSMIMSFFNPAIPLNNPGAFMIGILGVLVFLSEAADFFLLKKYGFLSSLAFRLGYYSIWHVLWPIVFY